MSRICVWFDWVITSSRLCLCGSLFFSCCFSCAVFITEDKRIHIIHTYLCHLCLSVPICISSEIVSRKLYSDGLKVNVYLCLRCLLPLKFFQLTESFGVSKHGRQCFFFLLHRKEDKRIYIYMFDQNVYGILENKFEENQNIS